MWSAEAMLDVAANNLANMQTVGFKQSQVVLATQPSVGAPGAQVGTGVQLAGIAGEMSPGTLLPATGPLSLAIEGNGYFVLEDSQGQRTYTRDGTFHANADGQLVAANGDRLLGLQGDRSLFQGELVPLFILHPQPLNRDGQLQQGAFACRYRVSPEGWIQSRISDGTVQTIGQIRLAQFHNPAGLRAVSPNAFVATASSGTAQISNPGSGGSGRLARYSVEASNTDVAQNLISMSRAELLFRANLKVLSTADSLWQDLLRAVRR